MKISFVKTADINDDTPAAQAQMTKVGFGEEACARCHEPISVDDLGGVLEAEFPLDDAAAFVSAPICVDCAPAIPDELGEAPLREAMRARMGHWIPLGPRTVQ